MLIRSKMTRREPKTCSSTLYSSIWAELKKWYNSSRGKTPVYGHAMGIALFDSSNLVTTSVKWAFHQTQKWIFGRKTVKNRYFQNILLILELQLPLRLWRLIQLLTHNSRCRSSIYLCEDLFTHSNPTANTQQWLWRETFDYLHQKSSLRLTFDLGSSARGGFSLEAVGSY